MVLQQLFTHRLIRILRYVLPVVVLVLVAIPTRNYWIRHNENPAAAQKPRQFPKGLSLLTEGFTTSRTDGGRTQFAIHAKSQLGFTDKTYTLQDVDVTIFGDKDSDPPRRVTSDQCTYDEASGEIHFKDNVVVQLDPQTTATTQELIYNHNDHVIVANQPIQLDRPGSFKGWANMLEYSTETGLLKLGGSVTVQGTDGLLLEAAAAMFQEKENWATASGGVYLKSRDRWIRGDHARAELIPDTYRPKSIVFEDSVTSESLQPASDSFRLKAAWVQALLSAGGTLEHVYANTNVEIEKRTAAGNQLLSGDHLDALLDSAGKLEVAKTSGSARMIFAADRTLQANTIYVNAAGDVTTEQESVLDVGDNTIDGRDFKIRNGDVVTFSTTRPAQMRTGDRASSADLMEATIDGKTNQLIQLVQTGHFQFTNGDQQGHSQRATVEDNGDKVTLEGEGVVSDSQMKLEAATIVVHQNDGSVEANGRVKTLSTASGEPIRVTSNSMSRTSEIVTYTGNVRFWRSNAYIQADQLKATSNNVFNADGNVQSTIDIMNISADKLVYDQQSHNAHYQGGVKARKRNLNIDASELTVKFDENDGKFTDVDAAGKVELKRADARGSGDRALYNATTELVTLTGVPANLTDKEHGLVQAPKLVMNVSADRTALVEGGAGQRTVSRLKVKK